MSLDNIQILELARRGLSAEEIAGALGYDAEAVSFILNADTEVSRKIAKVEKGKLAAEFEALEDIALTVVKEVMLDQDVKASTRLNAATYVIDERLGLKTPKTTNVTFNIIDFNERMKEVRRRREELEAVNVESKVTTKDIAA